MVQEQAPVGNGAAGTPAMKTASNSTLISADVFECYAMPPVNSLSGALVPRLWHIHSSRRRRIVSVEVHRVRSSGGAAVSYEECFVRVLLPASVGGRRDAKQRAKERRKHGDSSSVSHLGSGLVDDHSEGDDSTVVSPEFLDTAGVDFTLPDHDEKNWKAKYRFPIKAIVVKGTRKSSVFIEIKLGSHREMRELIFDNEGDSEKFQAVIQRQMALDKERTRTKMKVAMGGASIPLDENLTFLVEIVSGWDLPVGDIASSDPFVVCLMDGEIVHTTDFISKTLEPVWTVKTGSLFLMTVDVTQLFRSEGLVCVVNDYDKFGANERLGAIRIPPKTLYDAKSERLEFKLGPPPGKTNDVPGYLAIRCRRATEEDKDFMNTLANSNKRFAATSKVVEETASKGGAGNIKSIVTRRSRIVKSGPNAGNREYKIRPGPCPGREGETTWMTKEQLEAESKKESQTWVDVGTGKLGRLFVEILGCEDLPNLDTGGFAGNKTDAFVSLIYQDAVAQTDIVDDTLSPRWMPWTKRAFIFHIVHSSSQLFVGVFDYDGGPDDHDLIGRISVDISNLRKDTVYVLTYNIYTSATMSQRKKKGTLTLRLRLEIEDERKLLLSTMEPPPQMYVNVKTRKEFRVVRYTCTGKYNMEKYSMKVINSYIEELLALQHTMFYLQDAATALLLWRGTLRIPFGSNEFLFPIHSLSAFLTMVFLVEHPHFIPSFFFAAVAWVLLAAQDYRCSLPDVWSRCKSFREFIYVFAVGHSPVPPENIDPFENYDKAQEFLEGWHQRIFQAEEAAAKSYQEQLRAQEEYEKEMEELGDTADTDIATKADGGVSVDPFKGILFPVQQNLAVVCRYVRHVKHVISWQECYIAFWITTGCLLLSFICLFVPWFTLIEWTARVTVWALFGPQNKLVDLYFVSKLKALTEEQQEEKKKEERERRKLRTKSAVSEARIKRENAVKLKAFKGILFGKYTTRVPILKEDRYGDLPRPESTARPYKPDLRPISELAMQDAGYRKIRVPGQNLVGEMIPKVESHGFTEAPIGQPYKSQPGGALAGGEDSTVAAYFKIGSLVVASAALTWFGVPLLAAATERALEYI